MDPARSILDVELEPEDDMTFLFLDIASFIFGVRRLFGLSELKKHCWIACPDFLQNSHFNSGFRFSFKTVITFLTLSSVPDPLQSSITMICRIHPVSSKFLEDEPDVLRPLYSSINVVATNSQVSSGISFVLRGAAVNSNGNYGLIDAKSIGALWLSGMAAPFPILCSLENSEKNWSMYDAISWSLYDIRNSWV